jgi:predicted ATPase/class 3 adenylate cyclase
MFTDIEGSTRLWEQAPEAMKQALAAHDAIARAAVLDHRGALIKTTGDGIYAAFPDARDAVGAALAFQLALIEPGATSGVPLRVRCGLHAGPVERRDDDLFGSPVNRAARIMSAAHGGQVLVSQAIADAVRERLPPHAGLRDLGVVRLRDLASPERVHQLVHPRLRDAFPALRSLESTPNNLPQQIADLVGREREQAEVQTLLATARLVTLTGGGGLGKTRLALQIAANVLDDFPDGVWLVQLAPLTDARLVDHAIASALGVREDAGMPLRRVLTAHVRTRKLLLVLDNCEHVIDACAASARSLLEAGPQAKVLATSREPLRIRGETTYAVRPLGLPDVRASVVLDALARSEAVRLFQNVALAAQPGFQVTAANADAVALICRQLDGIPLAIELAAARVRAMPVQRIAERLADRFRLLTGGDRSALPRLQTLKACIDWSYELLSEEERTLFRRLSAFAGDFTPEAAEAVGAFGGLAAPSVFEVLARLVEKSLVERTADGERYRQLETIRQYAQQVLHDAGENAPARAQHLAYFVRFAEAGHSEFVGAAPGAWFVRLDRERENLFAAHASCDDAPGSAILDLKLVTALEHYWSFCGLLDLGRRITLEALARPDAQSRTRERCAALMTAGNLSFWTGHYGEAQRLGEDALSIARERADTRCVVLALILAGWASHALEDLDKARSYGEEALHLARSNGDRARLDLALNNLAEVHRTDGNLAAAEPLYAEALSLARECNDRGNIAINLFNLAMVAISSGSAERARPMLAEAHGIAIEVGSKRKGVAVLEVASALAAALGDWLPAARFFGAAEAQLAQMSIKREPADEAALAPLIARAREALGEDDFTQAEAAGHATDFDASLREVRAWLVA